MNYGSLISADLAEAVQMDRDDDSRMREGMSLEARSLVLRARAGDCEAFERLMILHRRQVLGTAVRILHRPEDAKDAAQEVFLKLYRYLPRIRADAELRPWLYRVTVNVCHDMMRKIGRFLPAPLENHADERERISSAEPGIEAVLVMQDRRRILHEALQTLPFKEKTALVLRDIEGLSTEETAHILGSTAATVRSQVASARIRIRRYCDRRLRRKK